MHNAAYRVFQIIAYRVMTQEFAMMRALGYPAIEASVHVFAIREDLRKIFAETCRDA